MEESLKRNKTLYKVFLVLLKYIPIPIAISYITNTLLCYTSIDIPVLSNIAGISLLPWVFMYIATFVFNFCTYHRLLLYYILLDDSINIIDYYFLIPVTDSNILMIHTSLIGILVIVLLANHVKNNKKTAAIDSGKN